MQAGLKARYEALNHLRIDFQWGVCRASLGDDPFDPSNWHLSHQSAHAFECRMLIVRPDFQWYRVGPPPFFDGGATSSWLDGKMVQVALDSERHWSVIIDRNRWEMHGPMPVLTPFEMQICDYQESLLDIVRRREVQITSRAGDQVMLEGAPTYNGAPSGWTIRAQLDPSRGWLPVELRAEIPRNTKGTKTIEWTMRTIASTPVRGVHAIREAIFALNNGVSDRWQIYHFNAPQIVRDDTLARSDLAVVIPEKNLRLVDRISGKVCFTNEAGEVIHEYVKTPEKVVADQEALHAAATLAAEAQRQLARRNRHLKMIVVASGLITLAAAGARAWRRHTQQVF